MLAPTTITTREMLRHAKAIFEQVKRTKQPAVVVRNTEPQVAIVSLEALRALQRLEDQQSAKTLLATVNQVRQLLKNEHLPADLSAHHNAYLWQADPQP